MNVDREVIKYACILKKSRNHDPLSLSSYKLTTLYALAVMLLFPTRMYDIQ